MFEVGTQVEYNGQSYQIISSRISPTGRRMYMLKSLTSDSRVGAFEEDLNTGSSVRTARTIASRTATTEAVSVAPVIYKSGGYLYLNFLDNLTQGSKSWDDFYTLSLTEQYDGLKRKLGRTAPNTLQELIGACCPSSTQNYYISMPSFNREMTVNRRGKECIYNIVIRPEKNMYARNYIPSHFDLIFIGDVTFGNVIDVTIKGIELIDSSVAKYGERTVSCIGACSFATKTFADRTGRSITVPDYGVREMHDAVLTRDFIDKLCSEVYPIPNPSEAYGLFSKWKKYLAFRRYYLGVQSAKCEAITDVSVKPAFMVSRSLYKKNEDSWHSILLDGHEEFSRGEQIVLSREVAGSDEFPLICVAIEKNRHDILLDTIGKGAKSKTKYEVYLRRYTRDSMGISSIEPQYDAEGNLPKGFRFSQFLLGERFAFAYTDIEPDCSALEKKCKKDIDAAAAEIDKKYLGIIMSDLEKYIAAQTPLLSQKYDRLLREFSEDLTDSLSDDVREHKDKDIKRLVKEEIERLSEEATANYKKAKKLLEEKIKAIGKDKTLSKAEKKKAIQEIEIELETLETTYKDELRRIEESIALEPYYIARNERLVENKKKSFAIEMQSEIKRLRAERQKQLEFQYKNQIQSEKVAAKEALEKQLQSDIAVKVENETVRRYEVYFRPDNTNDSAKEVQKDIEKVDCRFLTYDNRAEKAKIERQEKALASLLGGYVKNPYLASYLFAPQTLSQTTRPILEDSEIDWCLESLNDSQRLAVRRALSSESIFLLQGPPGTGKTQVIAEITAQLTKQGKKVLISSETHKAIDNVFERLPKIPEIRPLRLIPSQNGKETNFSPERLVDNFYRNIEESLRRQVDRFEHYSETKEHFAEEMKVLRLDYHRLLELQKANARIEAERKKLIERINSINKEIEGLRENLSSVKESVDEFARTTRYIETYRFDLEGVKEFFISEYRAEVESLLLSFSCFSTLTLADVRKLVDVDIAEIRKEIDSICGDDRVAVLESRRKELRAKLSSLRNPETDEAPEEGEEGYNEYKQTRAEFIAIGKEIKGLTTEGAVDVRDGLLAGILSPEALSDKAILKAVPEQLTAFRIKLGEIITTLRGKIERESELFVNTQVEIEAQIAEKQLEVNTAKTRYEELGENEGITEYEEKSSSLKQRITRFFRNFGIVREYKAGDFAKAFDIITEEWDRIEYNFTHSQAENKIKIPMFKDICGYLSSEDILEEDRQAYTKMLYENVNVFGITCTSRDRFTKTQLAELAKYNIESVDIRTQGIDVVIIDEVSKSSFLDLLIPILYGKTVILVGDHRQLPPMYDLRHMRENDFEGLDASIITKEINDGYTELYEECFFKTLYERVPTDYRVMLTKQYRCHSHIMEVFNHFYGGNDKGLTVGTEQQDDKKQHNLTVRSNGNIIIDPSHHIYFVDCNEKESSDEGSTSKINRQEAEVVMELLARINEAAEQLVRDGKVEVDTGHRVDERPSVGVICTYGDQAGLIKKRRKGLQFKGFSGKDDERLIISTVDDFQGDERDIIIVSMVRNPKDHRFNAEFVKQFERINVAFSRARKLLIIVGAKKFLSEQMIELPDLEGNHALDKHNYPVYKHIIDTIDYRGRLWSAQDIIGGEN